MHLGVQHVNRLSQLGMNSPGGQRILTLKWQLWTSQPHLFWLADAL